MPEGPPSPTAAFYFDLASPEAYLAAEQVLQVLPGPAEWRGVLAAGLAGAGNGGPPAAGEQAEDSGPLREAIAARVQALGLQPLRWPEDFPFDSGPAMLAATYARSIGRAVPFAQAAFRQAYAGGHSLAAQDTILIAGAACEMHPSALLRGAALRSVSEQLARTTAEAGAMGVRSVPAVTVGRLVFHGERALGEAAAAMSGQAP